jgi:transglutaminase-like putative cysteine protease
LYALQVRHAAEIGVPLVNVLAVLLAIRLLTGKQARDYLQIFVLALFILAGSSLLSLEFGFIVYLVLLVITVTVSLMLLTVFVTAPLLVMPWHDLRRLLRVALIMPAASLVLMLGFFAILPRTGQPLWNVLNPAGSAVAGLAESVRPGAFAQMSTAKTLAFRAEGPELPPGQRYWRALVMNTPDDGQWLRRDPPEEGSARLVGGVPVTLTIYPEPRPDHYLVTLDRPALISGIRSRHDADRVFQRGHANAQRFRYEVQAFAGADLQVGGRLLRDFYLVVPERVAPRVAAAAARIAASGSDSTARLTSLEGFFQERQLTFAQDNLAGGVDPIDDFLFDKRRGYCEYFASAYATLARLAGIPARLVGGYYGGDYNALGGYYVVNDDTAHVWVEVLTDEGFWRRVDPSQWASNAATALGEGRTAGLTPWQGLADTLDYFWVQSVLVFDLSRQLELLREGKRLWRELAPGQFVADWRFAGALLLLSVTGFGGLWLLRRGRLSREARLLAVLRRRMRRRYGPDAAAAGLTLGEMAARANSRPCREFAAIYQGAVFRDRLLTDAEVTRLRALLKEI